MLEDFEHMALAPAAAAADPDDEDGEDDEDDDAAGDVDPAKRRIVSH